MEATCVSHFNSSALRVHSKLACFTDIMSTKAYPYRAGRRVLSSDFARNDWMVFTSSRDFYFQEVMGCGDGPVTCHHIVKCPKISRQFRYKRWQISRWHQAFFLEPPIEYYYASVRINCRKNIFEAIDNVLKNRSYTSNIVTLLLCR